MFYVYKISQNFICKYEKYGWRPPDPAEGANDAHVDPLVGSKRVVPDFIDQNGHLLTLGEVLSFTTASCIVLPRDPVKIGKL